MKFSNRLKLNSSEKETNPLNIVSFATQCFAPFSEGFVIAGYSREKHSKFVTTSATAKVYLDAFEPCMENFMTWSRQHSDLFPDIFKDDVVVPVSLAEQLKQLKCFEAAVHHFAKASDAYFFMGYCNGERILKLYAEDPLMADAIFFLHAIAPRPWSNDELN